MSNTALTRVEKQEVLQTSGYSNAQLKVITNTVAQGATFNELALFLHQCRRTGLDPLGRQIHFVKYGQGDRAKVSIQTGIDGLRLIADRTGKYAGNDDYTFNGGLTLDDHIQKTSGGEYFDKYPRTATATVHKIVGGQRVAFTATAAWSQYYPGDGARGSMWRKMPHLMLGKCAEALALRKAFPAEMSGIYTADEMEQADGGFTDSIVEASTIYDEEDPDVVEGEAQMKEQHQAVEEDEREDAETTQLRVGVYEAIRARGVESQVLLVQAIFGEELTLAECDQSMLEKIVRVAKEVTARFGVEHWTAFLSWCISNGYTLRGPSTVETAVNDYRTAQYPDPDDTEE